MRNTTDMSAADVLLMHAENCFLVAQQLPEAETWMWVWLLRIAGAPA